MEIILQARAVTPSQWVGREARLEAVEITPPHPPAVTPLPLRVVAATARLLVVAIHLLPVEAVDTVRLPLRVAVATAHPLAAVTTPRRAEAITRPRVAATVRPLLPRADRAATTSI